MVLTRLVSRDGVDMELPLERRDLMLSLRQLDTESFPSGTSSSLTDPSVSHSIGVDEELLPDTVLAIESFFRWLMIGVILLLNLDSLLTLALLG